MVKVIGFKRQTGDYNGVAYDNIIIHCISNELQNVTGWAPVDFKFKFAKSMDMIGMNFSDLDSIIQKEIVPQYILYGSKPALSGLQIKESTSGLETGNGGKR